MQVKLFKKQKFNTDIKFWCLLEHYDGYWAIIPDMHLIELHNDYTGWNELFTSIKYEEILEYADSNFLRIDYFFNAS